MDKEYWIDLSKRKQDWTHVDHCKPLPFKIRSPNHRLKKANIGDMILNGKGSSGLYGLV